MTLSEVRDAFKLEYRLECSKRNITQIDFTEKEIAYFLAKVQQDLAQRLRVSVDYTDIAITPVSAFTPYSLPATFGLIKGKPEISGVEIDVVDISDIKTTDLITGTPSKCAIYYDGGYKIALNVLPVESATMRVWFYNDTGLYSPSGSSSQSWGSFNGSTFTSDPVIPERYIPLLILGMTAQMFPDVKGEYEMRINEYRRLQASSVRGINYHFGGIK